MLTIRQAAIKFGIPVRGLRRLVDEGKVPATRVGNRLYVSELWVKEKLAKDGSLD